MSKNITPYQDSNLGKKEQVAQMFDTISENYDGLNRVISFGTDAKWKRPFGCLPREELAETPSIG